MPSRIRNVARCIQQTRRLQHPTRRKGSAGGTGGGVTFDYLELGAILCSRHALRLNACVPCTRRLSFAKIRSTCDLGVLEGFPSRGPGTQDRRVLTLLLAFLAAVGSALRSHANLADPIRQRTKREARLILSGFTPAVDSWRTASAIASSWVCRGPSSSRPLCQRE